jgi:hypothetical protein
MTKLPQCHGFATRLPCLGPVLPGHVLAALFFLVLLPVMLTPALACDAVADRFEPVVEPHLSEEGELRSQSESYTLASTRLAAGATSSTHWSAFRGGISSGGIEIAALGPADRWGRRPAIWALRDASGLELRLPEAMLRDGSAYYWPDSADNPCAETLIRSERAARTERRGIWAGTGLIIRQPSAVRAAMADGKPLFLQARVDRVVLLRRSAYINFGREWAGVLSVSVELPAGKQARADVVTALDGLAGQMILVRGIAEPAARGLRLVVRDLRQITIEDGSGT